MHRLLSRLPCLVAVVVFAVSMRGDPAARLPDDWFTRPPTPERIKAVQQTAVSDGWAPTAARLYAGAVRGYELRQEEAATAWYYVACWCDLLGQSQRKLGTRWLESLGKIGGVHPNIDQGRVASLPEEPIVRLLSEESVAWLLGDRLFSESFFNALTPYDFLPGVMGILQALRDAEPRRFPVYPQLVLAIALVYDEPPPPEWPHWQVTEKVLPRRLPQPQAAFKFLADADQAGGTLQKLGTLSAGELKFVVDLVAPFPELSWARRSVKYSLADLVKSYEAVRYRTDRIEADQYVWPGDRYALPDIYGEGGICVDQAYFATQAGKARGVPTLLFSGAGQDGRHAWFGYLGTAQKWVLDAGRYGEQRLVTGVAYDPQTWLLLSDHELSFLGEGFRRLPAYRQSRQHQLFAELYLKMKQKPAAAAAARKAVNYERRNVAAWTLLVAAQDEAPVPVREALLREAAQALQRYPDLTARFTRELVASMRARGAASAADFEARSLVRREQTAGRSDLAVEHAVTMIDALKRDASVIEQMNVYRQALQQYGVGGGIDFFSRVTEPFIATLVGQGKRGEAVQVLAQTRAKLAPEADSQLDREMKSLADKLK
ncbi:MAG TPA: hypothetical protein VIO38_14945 [Rariglobus sp.]